MEDKKKMVVNNLFWRFLERCGAQGVTFIVSIVLARMLDPEVYGTIALVTVFTSILQVFIDGGLANSLIRKKNADDIDFSSVFYFNIIMCAVLYLGMYISAPYIAGFYENLALIRVIRILSLMLIFSGLKNVQQAYVSRHMLFRRFFFASMGGTIAAAVVGVYMAWRGYGVWAIVGQRLLNVAINTCILWFVVKWRPKLHFSWLRLKGLLSYGWRILAAKLIDTVYLDLRQLLIGKVYSSEDLAFYNQGRQFPHMLVSNINASIDSVLLPTLSKAQDDKDKLKAMTRRAIKMGTYIMMPMMVGLAVCAEPLVKILLTEKWLPCVTFLRIFALSYAFRPVTTTNLNAIKAMGRSDLFLRLEIIKKVVGVGSMLATMWISAEAVAYSLLFSSGVAQIINAWPNKDLLNYSVLDQLKDIVPQIVLSCLMGVVVICISYLNLNDCVMLLMQISVGVLVYVMGSILMKIDSFEYICLILKSYTNKRNRKKK